jgi:secreted trypsin-like serine protease
MAGRGTRAQRLGQGFALLATIAVLGLVAPAGASADAQPKIVGGTSASISQYPWQAAVVFSPAKMSGNAHNRQFCGGSLLTSRIVITAGHCVWDTDPDPGCFLCTVNQLHLDPDDVDVVLGRTTLSNTSEGGELGVIGVYWDPAFNPDYGSFGVPSGDVAFLVLGAASGQAQIKIAGTDEADLWDPGSPVAVSGWGATSAVGSTVDSLRAAGVNVIADSTCSSGSVYGGNFNPSTMLCAGTLGGGADACFGDSGGPLQAPVPTGGYRLVGVTSWGIGCGGANDPGVYARVAGDPMRSQIQADVNYLTSAFGLPAEPIFGSKSAASVKAAKKALKKCKRIRNKKKRRRCIKRVKKKFGLQA